MKHSENTLEIYVYSHCNMCNILIYFCNIKMKYLQHLDETLETCVCNIDFQRGVILLLRRMEACRCGARCRRGGRWWRMELVVRQRRGQLADRTTSHEAHPLACLLKHPSWRLAGSVETVRSEKGRGGEFYQQGVGERE
jgi:hypothetical protein